MFYRTIKTDLFPTLILNTKICFISNDNLFYHNFTKMLNNFNVFSGADPLDRENDDDSSTITSDLYAGRLPTPQWRNIDKPFKKVRHHLALTTPTVGGAILTSPPPQKPVSAWSGTYRSMKLKTPHSCSPTCWRNI